MEDVVKRVDGFWTTFSASTKWEDLLHYSAVFAFLAFAGHMVWYTVVGKIWNYWPWSQTTLTVSRALACATLQWVFFATFPILNAMIMQLLFRKSSVELKSWVVVCTYSLTPIYMAALFIGIPFLGRIATVLAMSTFLYLLYFGYREYLRQPFLRSAIFTMTTVIVFAFVRQVFVYVIGF